MFFELSEIVVGDLSHSSVAVHSFDFDFELKKSVLNYWKLSTENYRILVTKYIHLILIFELNKSFFKLLETFDRELSHSSDEVHSFDFDF